MRGDGDGWVRCGHRHRHWGVHGAAGLLLVRAGTVLMQHRAAGTSDAGTWGIPGGARDSHETVVAAALREAAEEAGIVGDDVKVMGLWHDAHGGWQYVTVLAEALVDVALVANRESAALRWVPAGEVAGLDLHPGFARTWPGIAAMLP